MNISEAKEIIDEAMDGAALSAYLCAESDEKIVLYYNGDWIVGTNVIDSSDPPLAIVACAGWHDVKEKFFLDGEVYDEETDSYIDEHGCHYSAKELIDDTCIESDVEDELSNLRTALLGFVNDRGLENGF